MDRTYIARELFLAAQELAGKQQPSLGVLVARELKAIGQGLTQKVNPGLRNVQKLPSNTSFAPALAAKLKKMACDTIEKQNKDMDINPSDLTRVWSAYFTFMDPVNNNHKYHYYAIYSFEYVDGSTRYVGMNCSGRIGHFERAYDLTLKNGRSYPALSEREAKMAIDKHLKAKTSKGYVLTKMTRG